MLWHRQAIFKSKGDKLCSSAECRIWTRGPRHQIASRLNARWQTDWAIEDQAKNLNSTARSYDRRAFSPLDPTVSWLSHLALAIYIFVVVNFDALAQASDIQIERRQVVFLHTHTHIYIYLYIFSSAIIPSVFALHWRHNEHDDLSNHRRLDGLLSHLFRRRSKKTSKLRIIDLRSVQVYCVAIFLVSQEVSLNFHRFCG